MTLPRSKLVDVSVTRWYHCISRCVRQASLLAGGSPGGDRKAWIERRLQQLDSIFAVSVGGFAILDNHLHVLLRLDDRLAAGWSDEEVVSRWFRLYPPRGPNRQPLSASQLEELRQAKLADTAWVAERRARLSSLSWFMKCLKEPLSRLVNRSEGCTGAFFEGRFKSIAVLDEEALLATCAYIDLNPVAAGLARTPEASEHTSVKARVEHVLECGRAEDLQAARHGSVAGSRASGDLEEQLWLIPVEDRRHLDSQREGMLCGLTLGNYLVLVEHTGRLYREGKAKIRAEVADILARIGSSADRWRTNVQQLREVRLRGRFAAASREALAGVAERFGLSRVVNRLAEA